jgi:energy-coupling factor transporter ATP-binding protein EcfA2
VADDHDPLPFPPAPPETVGSAERFTVRIAPKPPSEGGTVTVPAPIEFELRAGAPVALTGPNGSGKSVTLETLAGMAGCPQLAVTRSGAADGPDPGGAPVLLAQYPELQVFGDSVAEEIAFGLRRRGRMSLQDSSLRPDAGLSGTRGVELSRSPWALSTGERRLVQTVGALVTPASLLLLDEPTAGWIRIARPASDD